MRAEYVAPLGSSSLVFNFLFARFLVGTPVTSTDIYVSPTLNSPPSLLTTAPGYNSAYIPAAYYCFATSTQVVVLGVSGIVAFGSINSGLATETDVTHLTSLWRRGGWLGYFFFMGLSLIILVISTGKLDAILAARADLSSVPFAPGLPTTRPPESNPRSENRFSKTLAVVQRTWTSLMVVLGEWLELWTAPKDDTTIAWTLGIGWACCGGGLAGGCLVFAKAT
jgi:hypothetical protein